MVDVHLFAEQCRRRRTVISVDATPRDTSRDGRNPGVLIPLGIPRLRARQRCVNTGAEAPGCIRDHQSEHDAAGVQRPTERHLHRHGHQDRRAAHGPARSSPLIPDFPERQSFWQVAPAAAMNLFLRALLAE
jgi:hypothetical protein